MVGAVLPDSVRHVIKAPVTLEKYTQVGAGSIILPGVIFEEGAVCGAMSFINKSIDEWSIYAGTPAVKIKDRSKQLIEIKRKILDELLCKYQLYVLLIIEHHLLQKLLKAY